MDGLDPRVAAMLLRAQHDESPPAALSVALSVDPPIMRDFFFHHIFDDTDDVRGGCSAICLRIDKLPMMLQRAVATVLALHSQLLSGRVLCFCLARAAHVRDKVVQQILSPLTGYEVRSRRSHSLAQALAGQLHGTRGRMGHDVPRPAPCAHPDALDSACSAPHPVEASTVAGAKRCWEAAPDHPSKVARASSPGLNEGDHQGSGERPGRHESAGRQQEPSRASSLPSADTRPNQLLAEEAVKLKSMQTRLKGLRAHASEADVPAGLTSVLLMKPLDEALVLLQLGELPDEVLAIVGKALLKQGMGIKQASAYMSVVLLPKLQALSQPASRALLSAVTDAAKLHSRAAQDALILPLLAQQDAVGTSQVEVLNRVVKDCIPLTSQPALLLALIHRQPASGDGPRPLNHTDVAVILGLLSAKPPLSEQHVAALVAALGATLAQPDRQRAAEMAASNFFSNLVLAVISKFRTQAAPSAVALQQVTAALTTTLKKAIVSLLARLSKPTNT